MCLFLFAGRDGVARCERTGGGGGERNPRRKGKTQVLYSHTLGILVYLTLHGVNTEIIQRCACVTMKKLQLLTYFHAK